MSARVRFVAGGPIELPELVLRDGAGLDHQVAAHVMRRARRLKRGKWFVQVAQDGRGGYVGFHGSDDRVEFRVV